jgi:hypothetical protein
MVQYPAIKFFYNLPCPVLQCIQQYTGVCNVILAIPMLKERFLQTLRSYPQLAKTEMSMIFAPVVLEPAAFLLILSSNVEGLFDDEKIDYLFNAVHYKNEISRSALEYIKTDEYTMSCSVLDSTLYWWSVVEKDSEEFMIKLVQKLKVPDESYTNIFEGKQEQLTKFPMLLDALLSKYTLSSKQQIEFVDYVSWSDNLQSFIILQKHGLVNSEKSYRGEKISAYLLALEEEGEVDVKQPSKKTRVLTQNV